MERQGLLLQHLKSEANGDQSVLSIYEGHIDLYSQCANIIRRGNFPDQELVILCINSFALILRSLPSKYINI